MAAMTFVTSMCVFQLTRNVFMNPDVSGRCPRHKGSSAPDRVNKVHRTTAVLENHDEGEKYAEHGLRKFLRTRPPEIMPTVNSFFSDTK
ncbi:putative NADH-ubiquinone reductase complex 1 MLRQ subunit [Helianthus annuus]|nr:putative NADH-ubiquinone reductase complex 1 MLRQ subunit [Helianthus annuus]